MKNPKEQENFFGNKRMELQSFDFWMWYTSGKNMPSKNCWKQKLLKFHLKLLKNPWILSILFAKLLMKKESRKRST
jgi:hypothetical protein